MKKALAVFSAVAVLGAGGTVVADRQIDPYTDKGTHFELPIKSDFDQGERVEIHKDKAQMDLIGWNDEYKISIIPQIPAPTGFFGAAKPFTVEASRPLLSKKMEYRAGEVTAFIEPKEGTENEFDIDFTLDSKPDTNIFTYKIEGAEEFDFLYQPPEWCGSEGVQCPENVVGSYAVYHKTKANHRVGDTNYATGKAFHIYRPKAIDADGAEVWAELSYSDDVLSVTVSQKFLDDAVYPVVVDPTIGLLGIGAGDISIENITQSSLTYTPSSGTISQYSIAAKISTANKDVQLCVYDSSKTKIASCESDALTVSQTTYSFENVAAPNAPAFSDSTNYLAAMMESDSGTGFVAADSGWVESTQNIATYPTFPATITAVATNHYSIYATYTSTCTGVCTEIFVAGVYTWVAPAGVTTADVACWGGGGGGFDYTDTTNAGAGGGGGAFASSTVAVTPTSSYTVTAATSSPENLPVVGKFSQFVADDKTVKACGGTGATSATANGVGGTTACSTGDTEAAGGAGADAVTTNDTGGGGGGAGGPGATGGVAANGQAATGGGGGGGRGGAASGVTGGTAGASGGNGGDGVTTTFSAATSNGKAGSYGGGGGGGGDDGTRGGDGGFPGGGGGGAEGNGGLGAAGQCTITYTVSAGGGGTTVSRQSIIWFIED